MSMWRVGADLRADPDQLAAIDQPRRGWQGFVNTVTRWLPGDVLVVYGLLRIVFGAEHPRLLLALTAVVGPLVLVLLGAFSTERPITTRAIVAVVLGVPATALWAGALPSNAWLTVHSIGQHREAAACAFVIAGILFGLIADAIVKRVEMAKAPSSESVSEPPPVE